MSDIAIRVEGLSKQFRIGSPEGYRTLRESLADAASAPLRLLRHGRTARASAETFWALKDVSFDVKRGEVIGIIGRNGAGKSTLLKILSRITEPTHGHADIHGRVGSLLEVGTGFHPELSGRENIFLNGAILGMKRAEILRKFDEIVDFAEVEKFIDTPVKHYSSGMYMRLAFAVAAHMEPEILIIDEVLAVGDAKFQEKCLGKMRDVSRGGRTVVFVSHQLQPIRALTQRCALLEFGRCIRVGDTGEIVAQYLRTKANKGTVYEAEPHPTQPILTHASVLTSRPHGIHYIGDSIRFVFRVNIPIPVEKASFSFQVFDNMHNPVLHILVLDAELPLFRTSGLYELTCDIPQCRLYIGEYTVATHLAGPPNGQHYETATDICSFEVVSPSLRDHYWRPGTSAYLEDSKWSVKALTGTQPGVMKYEQFQQ